MMEPHDRFIVFTGGPGSGKTSLIAALAAEGFATMPEAGRAIIRDQVAIGGAALPWADRDAFAGEMLAWDMRSYHGAQALTGPILFDRGIVDVIGYRRLCGLAVPAHLERAAATLRYGRIFLAPPWRAIFAQDAERRQDWDEAVATCAAIEAAYRAAGYDLVLLPRAPLADRVVFVRDAIG